MKKLITLAVLLAAMLLIAGWLDPAHRLAGWADGDSFFQGKPTRYWVQRLQSKDPATSEKARRALHRGASTSVPVLVEMVRYRSDDAWSAVKVRWLAADALGKIGIEAQSATTALVAALDDVDDHVRAVAACSLPAVDAPADQAVPALIRLVERDPSVLPIRALSEYGPEAREAVPELVAVLSDEELNSEIRWNAIRTLGKMHGEAMEAIPALVEQLQNPVPSIREHAAEALGEIGLLAQPTAAALLPLLKDTVPQVRRDAARSLAQIQASAAVAGASLQVLLNDPESIVREAAHTALQTIAPEMLVSPNEESEPSQQNVNSTPERNIDPTP